MVDFLQLSATWQLAEVLGERSNGHPVYRIDPVTDLAGDGRYRPLDALADDYADACAGMGLGQRGLAVAGYCSAAALALLLAARLAAAAPVSPILVQPAWPDARAITADFGSFRTDLGAPGDQPSPAEPACGLAADMAASPDLMLDQMHSVLRRDLQAMAAARGLDGTGPGLADLLARYRAWLGFLLASHAALQRPWPRQMHPLVLLGADAEPLVPWSDPGSYRVVRLQVPEAELLAGAGFADSLLALTRAGDGGAG